MPIPTLTITAIIDILAVAFVIYQLLEIVRGTRAAHILVGILAVVITYEIALRTGLEALRSLLASLAPYCRHRHHCPFSIGDPQDARASRQEAAVWRLSQPGIHCRDFAGTEFPCPASELGALIVVERDIGLRTFIESGVRLDSQISRDLLLSIFLPWARRCTMDR